MSVIFCDINLGIMEQNIIFIEDNNYKNIATTSIDSLGEIFPALCRTFNTNNIRLRGNKDFLDKLVKDIKENEMYVYNTNNINIEVI